MVEDHRPIASTNEPNLFDRFRREHVGFFQKSCHVRVALTDVMLSCSQVAINETQTRIVNYESCNNATLQRTPLVNFTTLPHSKHGVQIELYLISISPSHSPFNGGDRSILQRNLLCTLDKHTREQPHQTLRMKHRIR
jgi:hypothetical protein